MLHLWCDIAYNHLSAVSFDISLPLPRQDNILLANFCGPAHVHVVHLERIFRIRLSFKDKHIIISASTKDVALDAKSAIEELLGKAQLGPLDARDLPNPPSFSLTKRYAMSNTTKIHRKKIVPKNPKQEYFLRMMDEKTINFAIGPAGTGKTYLAVSKAIEAFEKGEVQRLVFVRPAVEAGEKLGFLPGDLVEKVLPYLRPIYDALYEMLGFKETQKLVQTDVIEILPLAFMRGRTLNEAFIILDEAQNATIMQMKMFLTRMGFHSRAVITGDTTQIDLPKGTPSGLQHATRILQHIDDIGFHQFTSQEVVRHPLISQIIDSYEGAGD